MIRTTPGIEAPSLIPPYTRAEAREDLLTDIGPTFRHRLNRHRRDIRVIEIAIRSKPMRRLLNNEDAHYHRGTDWTYQHVIERCIDYDRMEANAMDFANEALNAEMEARRRWEEVARARDEQGKVLEWLWSNGLQHAVARADEAALIGDGTANDPLLIDL